PGFVWPGETGCGSGVGAGVVAGGVVVCGGAGAVVSPPPPGAGAGVGALSPKPAGSGGPGTAAASALIAPGTFRRPPVTLVPLITGSRVTPLSSAARTCATVACGRSANS